MLPRYGKEGERFEGTAPCLMVRRTIAGISEGRVKSGMLWLLRMKDQRRPGMPEMLANSAIIGAGQICCTNYRW